MITVNLENETVVIDNIGRMGVLLPKAVQRGLSRSALGIKRAAHDFLSGSKKDAPGSYPVPVRTGNLRRLLGWLPPGKSKALRVATITAGPDEAVVYDSAEVYARVIHDGTGSSSKFGPRSFLTDAFEEFNQGSRVAGIIDEEIEKAWSRYKGDYR